MKQKAYGLMKRQWVVLLTGDIMVGSIQLEFSQFGTFDSFSVYRSLGNIDINNLPEPIATGLTKMRYVDSAIESGEFYFYMVSVVRGEETLFSSQVMIQASNNILLSSGYLSSDSSWRKTGEGVYTKSAYNYSKLGLSGSSVHTNKEFEISFIPLEIINSPSILLYVRNGGNTSVGSSALEVGKRVTFRVVAKSVHQGFSFWLDNYNFIGTLGHITISQVVTL